MEIGLYNDSFALWGSKRINDTELHELNFYAIQALTDDTLIASIVCENIEGDKTNIPMYAGGVIFCSKATSIQLSGGDVFVHKEMP